MRLINWPWLEDLLVRAVEAEIREFGSGHRDEPYFAFCVEFDCLTGSLELAYGRRPDVDACLRAVTAEQPGEPVCYRALELRPENWKFHAQPIRDVDGAWRSAASVLEHFQENIVADEEPDVTEFLWMRFEYLVECVVRRLIDRDAFRTLPRDPEFLAYAVNPQERLEELEDRIGKLYPGYRRATFEWSEQPRPGELLPSGCQAESCARPTSPRGLMRCTSCHGWFCSRCRKKHGHPELSERQPFFWSIEGLA